MILIIAIVLVACLLFAWGYVKDKRLNYWARKGVQQLEGTDLIYGDNVKIFKNGESLFDVNLEHYQQFKQKGVKFGGKYSLFGQPTIVFISLELIKNVLVRDFEHFMDHGVPNSLKSAPLSKHLFNLGGNQWKSMRQKLSPTFSSGKIKTMFQILQLCTSSLKEALEIYASNKEPVDIQDTLARFTTDVIGNCAFGVESNSLKDPDAEFRHYGKKIFENSGYWRIVKMTVMGMLPLSVVEFLGLKTTDPEVESFFLNMVKTNAEYREKNKVIRNDFFQLLLQLKNEGQVENNDDPNNPKTKDGTDKLTLEEIAAQCYVFFIGGFDTSSNTMSFALYELAENQEIQDKLRQSIHDVLKKHATEEITYDAIHEMEYLDKVLNESIRKYPLACVLSRQCTKEYRIPDTDIIIEKGTRVHIPAAGLHRDPEYYPEPLKFDPERFNKENTKSRPPVTYLPFGEGPRQCIGTRFGLLQSKMGLATVIKNFRITINKEKSELPLKIKQGFISSPKEIYLNVEKIN